MMFDGERFRPENSTADRDYASWHRYLFASEFVQSRMVLDIGCGEGFGTFHLSTSARKVIGIDIDAAVIHRAASKYVKENLEFLHGSATSIPVRGDGVFDVITAFAAIEHLTVVEQEQFLKEVKRLLKPGGLFLVSTPNKLLQDEKAGESGQNWFYIDSFSQLLRRHFTNLVLFGENAYPVSYIWPVSADPVNLVEHKIELGENGFQPSSAVKQVSHVVAICSDAALAEARAFVQVDLSKRLLIERNQQIEALGTSLTAALEEKTRGERELHKLAEARERNEEEIEILTARVSDRERVISHLQDQIAQLEQEIRALKEQVKSEYEQKEAANWTLAMIYGSTAWKIIKVMWAVRLFLAPHGSRREAFARALSEVLQGLRDPFAFLKRKPKTPPAPQPESAETADAEAQAGANPVYTEVYEGMLSSAVNAVSDTYVELAEKDFPLDQIPLKLIAFYLPQFHPIPENDTWWGKGFTEWRNVTKAVPQFAGHYQPHLPGELGFYDLRVPDVQERQVELARKYGIAGFCFYYYWFHGKRLLERPLDQFLENPNIDFPFCLCWANENWTRRWDGNENEVLIAQDHSEESDMNFIRDILPFLNHKNYIKINGRPVLIVYRISILPNPQVTIQRWKKYCRSVGAPEPYLVAVKGFGFEAYEEAGFDAAVEFPPPSIDLEKKTRIEGSLNILNPGYKGIVFDYGEIVRDWQGDTSDRVFATVFPAWDNEPRKPGRGSTFAYSSPALYQEWLTKACLRAMKNPKPEERIVFINAWNEWAEGAHLEPDRKYGYAYLQATANALAAVQTSQPITVNQWTILFISHDASPGGAQSVLLDVISWMREHTSLRMKVLCLNGGDWLNRFERLADTLVLRVEGKPAAEEEDAILQQVMAFCGEHPDLIYANTVSSGRILHALSRLNAPILTHVHELETSIQKYGKEWIADTVELSSHFIACSPAVRENLIQKHQVDADSISIIYASIRPDAQFDPQRFGPTEKWAMRERLGLPQKEILVFGCGVGLPFRKGADLFIEAARIMHRKGCRNFHFYWIGDFDQTEQDENKRAWGDYLRELRESGFDRYITFLGFKANAREFLLAGDIFVLPSREDPFPLVALEAADYGMPIVCFAGTGGIPHFVGEDAGFVVPAFSVEAMAASIIRLIEREDLRREKGLAAREKFLKNYTIDQTAPQILSMCRRAANKKPTVSVIVPNYNHAQYLPRRMDSILQQSYRDFELILLDDASTDNSVEVLEQYAGGVDVRLVKNERNTGSPCLQWLKGMDVANGEILWIAESDDASEKGFLAALLPAFNDPSVALAYSDSRVIDDQDAVFGDYQDAEYLTSLSPTKWRSDYTNTAEQEINDALGVKNTILNISSALLRKKPVDEKARDTLASMRIAGDWYFIVRQIKDSRVRYTAARLNYHRRHVESVIGKTITEKRIQDFFREFCVVQQYIFENYLLREDFVEKWEAYLRKQWNDFYPNRPFENIQEYYPFSDMEKRISRSSQKPNSLD